MDSVQSGSCSSSIFICRKELIEVLTGVPNDGGALDKLLKYLKNEKGIEELSDDSTKKLGRLVSTFVTKWKEAHRNKNSFNKKNKEWVNGLVQVTCNVNTISLNSGVTKKKSCTVGRPSIDFLSLSDRSKRMRTESLRKEHCADTLAYATQMKLRSEQKKIEADIVKDIIFTSPNTATQYKDAHCNSLNPHKPYTPTEALSILVEAKLSKEQYNVLRNTAKKHGCNLYPRYESVIEAKKMCYPNNVSISETTAKVPLQELLNHTTNRLCLAQKEVLLNIDQEDCDFTLVSKWGCDGASGMSEYKQKFENASKSDGSVFAASVVPIQLRSITENSVKDKIIWQNTRTSSPRYCRPIYIEFIHETKDLINKVVKNIENQIDQLQPTKITIQQRTIYVKHHLILTMIDGKVCNAIVGNSSTQKCYICGLTSKDFNNIDLALSQPIHESCLKFGLSPLHAWICFFECLLRVSYKLCIKQWQARGSDNKHLVNQTKSKIQAEFKLQLGLLVDKPKSNYGNSNDGNTARRFFEHHDISARVTGIDEDLIKRFYYILLTISSGYNIDVRCFEKYCLDTAKKFVSLYGWYNMSTTVHKILIHSAQVISEAILPIGQLGEEAQEARIKDLKKLREFNSRKFSRVKNLEDVFHGLLISSDPYISSLRILKPKKFKQYPNDVLQFFKEPDDN